MKPSASNASTIACGIWLRQRSGVGGRLPAPVRRHAGVEIDRHAVRVRALAVGAGDLAPHERAGEAAQVGAQRRVGVAQPLQARGHRAERVGAPAVDRQRASQEVDRHHVDRGARLAVGGGEHLLDADAAGIVVGDDHRADRARPVADREHVLDVGRVQLLVEGLGAPVVVGHARSVGQAAVPVAVLLLGRDRVVAREAGERRGRRGRGGGRGRHRRCDDQCRDQRACIIAPRAREPDTIDAMMGMRRFLRGGVGVVAAPLAPAVAAPYVPPAAADVPGYSAEALPCHVSIETLDHNLRRSM